MDRKISDEQLDRIAGKLLENFALNDEMLDEIAASPRLLSKVRAGIEEEKTRRARGWMPTFRLPVWAFGVGLLIVCVGFAAMFFSSGKDQNLATVEQDSVQKFPEQVAENETIDDRKAEISKTTEENNSVKNLSTERVSTKSAAPKVRLIAKNQTRETASKPSAKLPKNEIAPAAAVEETKTDFIALTYAANTDSGQIVRVKVPSSMMVSLGLKSNVEKESEMVNAEVVVGIDGTARAIRFIR